MLLVIDVGNSHTVFGLYEGDELRTHWRMFTDIHRTRDELSIFLYTLLQREGIERGAIHGCCISSVVPPLNTVVDEMCREDFGIAPLFVGPGVKTGLTIQVENPKEVGADRIVNAVAAIEEYGAPLIVVDFGTATTLDVISRRREYRGGVICPGIQISAEALFEHCAKLPRVDLSKPATVIGRDTVSHIRSGLSYGYADMVDGLVARIIAEMDDTPKVVATGGFASFIAEVSEKIDEVDNFLTLRGLRLIHAKNERAIA